jgi:hypothetical protein
VRLFPKDLYIRDPTRDYDEVERAVANNLIGDAHLA